MSERLEVTRTNQERETRIPAYLELARELEAKIRSGALPPGSQLPPQRDLARERSLNVSTVTRAYRELQNLNLVMGSTRRGTIVMGDGAMPRVDRAANPSGVIDLTVNRPAVDDFQQRLAQSLPDLSSDRRFRQMQEYQPPEGPAWARHAAREWISLNGFDPSEDDIVVTSGAQHALLAVISSLIEPGDTIVCDRLTYYGLIALAQMFRFRIIGIGSDDQGMSAAELDDICGRESVRAVFTVPSMHNPTVVTMSEARRRDLVDVAEKHDLVIIEDDVYGPMLGTRASALITLAPTRTYHISALSKALAPGLRVGYLLCPPGRALLSAEAVRTTAWMPSPLPLLLATRWLEDGTAEAILKAQLAELRARYAIVTTILAGHSFSADPRCMFLWLRLPAPWRCEDFAANLRAHGVAVMAATAFACDRQPVEHAVRVNVGCASSRDELATALRIIAATLNDRPRALAGLV
ncbi:PLP-dependent aminotransferase family protein [Rhizobium leguminosarum]|jgi:DNA-binding transcriptional MocR family regulator|uniref:PLP-dependent aminotransferase family protein n=2 Tax=Rhizobium TaxID=379 RepID=A0A444HXP7_RHILE|nr:MULTISPECIES: PLP-dependent aminotransferase family protein [Rhizobium]MBY5455542.1 PLP-dependent aminotransferase family protein [Rhizobium leguminosarum]NKL65640.1 aminotransferase class I/II-fold pyridoxal phosphate-dependent enzyme [Rhizobium leguminosarum bv. viciae]RWX14823.1 PLP-dependent aminotransferase family protein [Rhizobium leguminosarum]RWX28908.1 PLP-dependent aminotransferase family protein [Rhizobium leguminosarum]TBC61126.1 PLP-dependent aminotransferase family protein [R